ncbi:MAG: response regulator [Anaerolineae bacterium]|nr:response regulator [Anaerolineae bacterium]
MSTKGDILIIDDDPDFCEVVKAALEADNFAVRTAEEGARGLAMMREQKPDLVFLDVIMVSPTEGCYVADEIFDDPELRQVPVVMVTSVVDSEYLADFPTDRALHVDLFLEKPVPLDKFVELANRFAPR